ncbi:MAG: CotH kinase family protein [Tidjanibacter sp.]|nr:CotH kinase family protein [Tidjanibacter sp.]
MKKLLYSLFAELLLVGCCTDGPDGPDEPIGPIVPPEEVPGRVVLNEVNARHQYIELYNVGDTPVAIGGATFRKNNGNMMTDTEGKVWTIPAGVELGGKSYALIGCDGKTDTYDCTNFYGTVSTKLDGDVSMLLEMLSAEGERIDFFVNTSNTKPKALDKWGGFVEHSFDVAARIPNGEEWWVTDDITPGRENNTSMYFPFKNTTMNWVGSGEVIKEYPEYVAALEDLFNFGNMPAFQVRISQAEWNRLLEMYDHNPDTKQYVMCDVAITRSNITKIIREAGLRLRGNTSRRRPESIVDGITTHRTDNTDWNHCHFGLNFRKFHKDSDHTINGVRKVNLKWFKDDPMYVRELYCYDLFRRFGIWTAINDIYCRLSIHVEGDSVPAYYGVYQMTEAIDDEYLKARSTQFGGSEGNLWKCRWGADLRDLSDESKFGLDVGTDEEWTYELKTENASFSRSKAQLQDFIYKVNHYKGQQFHDWIAEVTDVELLLRTYAVNVMVGMWDDYWNNCNNYYLYFNRTDEHYKFFLIPYDYDNTLGTSNNCGVISDSGTHNPLQWGDTNKMPLIGKILEFEDYRKIYIAALKELATEGNDLFYVTESMERIRQWQGFISRYVPNDTGEDMEIKDRPASWGNQGQYRLLSPINNFFVTKVNSLPN